MITLDGYAASHRAVAQTQRGRHPYRSGTDSIQQIFEQRRWSKIIDRIKTAHPADARVQALRDGGRDDSGIESAEKIKKRQFNLKPLTGKAATTRELWADPGGLKSEKPLPRRKLYLRNLHQSPCILVPAFFKVRHVPLHPAQDGRMS